MCFKIDWASQLEVNVPFLHCFTLYLRAISKTISPRRGDLTECFLLYEFGGLIFRGAYTWRGLFWNFTVLVYGNEVLLDQTK